MINGGCNELFCNKHAYKPKVKKDSDIEAIQGDRAGTKGLGKNTCEACADAYDADKKRTKLFAGLISAVAVVAVLIVILFAANLIQSDDDDDNESQLVVENSQA